MFGGISEILIDEYDAPISGARCLACDFLHVELNIGGAARGETMVPIKSRQFRVCEVLLLDAICDEVRRTPFCPKAHVFEAVPLMRPCKDSCYWEVRLGRSCDSSGSTEREPCFLCFIIRVSRDVQSNKRIIVSIDLACLRRSISL